MRDIVLIAHDMRSCHNVGSLLRTAEGVGVHKVFLTGYTPYPIMTGAPRLPHLAQKISKQIAKTSLGAETTQTWQHSDSAEEVLSALKQEGYQLAALEQTNTSTPLPNWQPAAKIAIVLGREVEGIDPAILALCDTHLEIPMFGQKESFNVVQAAAMTLYHCRFSP